MRSTLQRLAIQTALLLAPESGASCIKKDVPPTQQLDGLAPIRKKSTLAKQSLEASAQTTEMRDSQSATLDEYEWLGRKPLDLKGMTYGKYSTSTAATAS